MLKGIYVLPSVITSANLAAGFLSIIFSINSQFTPAAWAIIAAMALDIMDGRVARWTKSTSQFGIELDSLSDMVSFGVAPSVMMYQMVLNQMQKPGIMIAVFFVIAGALRLARFNVKAKDGESSSDFLGLPIPAAAGILASFVLSYELFEMGSEINVKTIPVLMNRMPFFFKSIPITMIIISILMISNIPYLGFKRYKFDRPKSLQILVLVVLSILLVVAYPQNTIFIIFLLYLISGIAIYFWRYWRLRSQMKSLEKTVKKDD